MLGCGLDQVSTLGRKLQLLDFHRTLAQLSLSDFMDFVKLGVLGQDSRVGVCVLSSRCSSRCTAVAPVFVAGVSRSPLEGLCAEHDWTTEPCHRA